MQKRWVIGNWKMNGDHDSVAKRLQAIQTPADNVVVAVAPPALYLSQAQAILADSQIALAAQNVCAEAGDDGAYTGEIAAAMLAQVPVQYVIVGHSERRQYYAESDQQVSAKFARVLEKKMQPILCIGESLQQKQAGQTQAHLAKQLQAVIEEQGIASFAQAIIAYEPIWAIGTGLTATPEQAQAVHAFIRQVLAQYDENIAQQVPILYGGSVKASNADALFLMQDINGVLVGGASLDANEFNAIIAIAR